MEPGYLGCSRWPRRKIISKDVLKVKVFLRPFPNENILLKDLAGAYSISIAPTWGVGNLLYFPALYSLAFLRKGQGLRHKKCHKAKYRKDD
jgi:hypothetical protein